MSTTTIRLDETLKTRVAAAAERTGKTTHAFMLEAIERTVEQLELEEEMHQLAEARWARLLDTGTTISWDEAKDYVTARVRGDRPRKPRGRKPESA